MHTTFAVFLALTAATSFAKDVEKISRPIPAELVAGARIIEAASLPSPDGQLIAVTVINGRKERPLPDQEKRDTQYLESGVPNSKAAQEIWIVNLADGSKTELNEGAGSTWGASWSPDGSRLAFYSDAGGTAGLWVWDRRTVKVRRVSQDIVRVFQSGDPPAWMSDRELLAPFLGEGITLEGIHGQSNAAHLRDGVDRVTVKLLSEQLHMDSTGYLLLEAPVDLAIVDLDAGAVRRIAKRQDVLRYAPSPDGSKIAYSVFSGSGLSTLRVCAVADGSVFLEWKGQAYDPSFSWSADGAYIAYRGGAVYTPMLGDIPSEKRGQLIEVGTWKATPLPNSSEAGLVWSSVGHTLYFASGTSVYRLSAGASEKPLAITFSEPITHLVTDWQGRLSSLGTHEALMASDSAFYTVDFGSLRKREIFRGAAAHKYLDPVGLPGQKAWIFARRDIGHYPDLWRLEAGSHVPRRLTTLNPELDRYATGTGRLIEWTDRQGRHLVGALLLPPGYESGKRYPVLVDVYGGRVRKDVEPLLRRSGMGFAGENSDNRQWNYQLLASRGYAVFAPEVPYGANTVMKDLADAVLPGVDRLIELGIADPARLAVAGQSFGGYCVRALIAQTDRFKAAISTAGASGDLYTALWFPEGMAKGQLWITADPFKDRDVYLANSPFYASDKIKTPLLIQIGMNDGIGNNESTIRDYRVLKYLGVDVEVLEYFGESHTLLGYSNQVDFWNRRIAWLEKYMGPSK